LRWVLVGTLAVGLVVGGAYLGSERVRERVDLVLSFDPSTRSADAYQLRQSLIGLGAGGFLGQGAGQSRQARFLPDHHTDFIFAIVGEEYGLVGTLALLFLLLAIPLRILRLARQQSDDFAFYLAAGVAGMLFVYTSLNIAVAVGLFPVTGVPLPFVSHGGSALVINLSAVGFVLGLSRETARIEPRSSARGPLRRARRQDEPLIEDLYRRSRP
jgi:cell division protein FtsW